MKWWRNFGFHVVGPVVLGSAIYLVCRSPTLRVFDWVAQVGAARRIETMRAFAWPVAHSLPEWLRFSIPDGLWTYALTSAMGLVWSGRHSAPAFGWMMVGIAFGAGGELGQAVGLVPGTFDLVDLAFVIFGFILAFESTWAREA